MAVVVSALLGGAAGTVNGRFIALAGAIKLCLMWALCGQISAASKLPRDGHSLLEGEGRKKGLKPLGLRHAA